MTSFENTVLFTFSEILCQTIAYGIFIAIIPISTHVLLKQGLKIRSNLVMLAITLVVFALSTAYWAVSVATLVSKITGKNDKEHTSVRLIFNAVVLINYLFADGVVVWRMRVLCAARFSRKVIMVPSIMLALTTLTVLITIVFRAIVPTTPDQHPKHAELLFAVNVLQIVNLVFSLITNVVATGMIGAWAWQYRRSIRANLSSSRKATTQVERILVLLAESGLLYCTSSFLTLVGSFIHVPGGTFGDIYTNIHVQIAGMYPAFVMILVNTQRTSKALTSVSEHSEPNTLPRHHETNNLESMRFNDNPVPQHGTAGLVSRQTQSAMLNVTIDTHDQDASFSTVEEEVDHERSDHGKDQTDPGHSQRKDEMV